MLLLLVVLSIALSHKIYNLYVYHFNKTITNFNCIATENTKTLPLAGI